MLHKTTTRVDFGRMIQKWLPQFPSSRLASHATSRAKPRYCTVSSYQLLALVPKDLAVQVEASWTLHLHFRRVNFQRCSPSTKTSRVIFLLRKYLVSEPLRLYGIPISRWVIGLEVGILAGICNRSLKRNYLDTGTGRMVHRRISDSC